MQGTPFFPSQKDTSLSSILFRSLVSKVALTVGGEHDHQPLKKHRDEHATGKNDDVVVIVCAPTRDAEREAKRRSICCPRRRTKIRRRRDARTKKTRRTRLGARRRAKAPRKRREGNPSSSSRNPRSQSEDALGRTRLL